MSVCKALEPPAAPGALPEHCKGEPNDFGYCPEHFRCAFEDEGGQRCASARVLPSPFCAKHRAA
jgi:hypothetical protein